MSWGVEGWGLVALGGTLGLISNIFYMWGGTEGFTKIWRRFVGASVLATGTNLLAILTGSWAWQYLTFYPLLMIGFSLGYGGDTTIEKIIRRSVYALGVLSCCIMGMWAVAFSTASIVVGILALITGLTSVALGVLNPFKSARLEEFMVSQVLTLYVIFWSYVK